MSDASPNPPRPSRPAAPQRVREPRPSAPTPRPASSDPTPQVSTPKSHVDALAELASIAGSGLAPSASLSSVYLPSPSLIRSPPASSRETLLPVCLTLGITLPILGTAWFLLDPHRVIRSGSLSIVIPIALFVAGAIALAALATMLIRAEKAVQ